MMYHITHVGYLRASSCKGVPFTVDYTIKYEFKGDVSFTFPKSILMNSTNGYHLVCL